MNIYTKSGDGGTTALIGGERVSKADHRVEAYGTVDELAANLALLADAMREYDDSGAADRFSAIIGHIDAIQRDLMTVEAMLAVGRGGENAVKPLPEGTVERLEATIDGLSEGLAPVREFVIPGGHPIVSLSHVCRTVCRRAERRVVAIPAQNPLLALCERYLNRLSDLLYVLGRVTVTILAVEEKRWTP